jgi:hypothetical protein
MKHAFLIMAHGSLPLLRVLLSMLDDERNDIFLHIDRKSDMLDGAEPLVLSKARLFLLEQRVDVRWGNLSQIKAEYVLFEEALKHGPYAYYHLLSGQDLPIKSQDYIHQFFEEHQGKEFVGINHGEEFEWDCRRKMMRYWLFTSLTRSKYGALNAITRRLNKYLSMLLMPFLHRQKMDFAKGANWVSITQACVEYVVSQKPFVLKRFNYTFCPDNINSDQEAQDYLEKITDSRNWRLERNKEYFMSLMNNVIESEANKYGFDSAISARSYCGTENKYQAFSVGFTKWSAEFWNVGEDIAASVMSGKRDIPTDDELYGLLPKSTSYISEDMIKSTLPNMGTSEDIDSKITDTSSGVQEPDVKTNTEPEQYTTYDDVPEQDENPPTETTN